MIKDLPRATSSVRPTVNGHHPGRRAEKYLCEWLGSIVMYQYWLARRHERNGQGPAPTAITSACGTSIHAAKKAITRYRRGRAAVPQPRGLDIKSIRNIHHMLSQAWVDTVGLGYLTANPAALARLPRDARRTEKRTLAIYTHRSTGRNRPAAEKVAGLIFGDDWQSPAYPAT